MAPASKFEKWVLDGSKGPPPKLPKWPPPLPGFGKRAFARHRPVPAVPAHRSTRRKPGRPVGSRNKTPRGQNSKLDAPKGGRPSTLHLRPDTPAKAILEAMGGVSKTQRLFVLAGRPYTKMALYLWLRRGYIPDEPLMLILETGQAALPGSPPFPEWLAEWNAVWDPVSRTPLRPDTVRTAKEL